MLHTSACWKVHNKKPMLFVSLPSAQADAEIIVTFEATTEFGNPFLSRQSYLPNEIHWCAEPTLPPAERRSLQPYLRCQSPVSDLQANMH